MFGELVVVGLLALLVLCRAIRSRAAVRRDLSLTKFDFMIEFHVV